ncbi:hypothetical protein AORI_6418 [Amycolatopsis keratiniphila]|uniref:Uncharacterized protein n=1 Tax=Amycolatopsis keratiniphila TaxID=129921 RepID=R4T9P6_9PSEU|nr:hypothetical protein AORI_6418 [Amycolatopsis keratiniphila]
MPSFSRHFTPYNPVPGNDLGDDFVKGKSATSRCLGRNRAGGDESSSTTSMRNALLRETVRGLDQYGKHHYVEW